MYVLVDKCECPNLKLYALRAVKCKTSLDSDNFDAPPNLDRSLYVEICRAAEFVHENTSSDSDPMRQALLHGMRKGGDGQVVEQVERRRTFNATCCGCMDELTAP